MGKGTRRGARHAAALTAMRSSAEDAPVLRAPAGERTEGEFTVRPVGASDRVYRCPGCAQEVARVPHVVAWPFGKTDERRHWHTPCWEARGRRGPTVERGRAAPRH